MDAITFVQQFPTMPEEVKKEVVDFAQFLMSKRVGEQKMKNPKFGSHPGVFKMAPDFDEPLEDFKEYTE